MTRSDFEELLYPGNKGDERDARLRRLREILDDPQARESLADYLHDRAEEEDEREADPDVVWGRAQQGKRGSEDTCSEIVELSTELAERLCARRHWSPSLPVSIWVPAAVGAVIGVLAVWIGIAVLPGLTARQHGSFTAAMTQLLTDSSLDAEDLESIDELLAWHEKAYPTGEPQGDRSAVLAEVSELLRRYNPDASEVRDVRRRVGIYHPPDENLTDPGRPPSRN